MKKIVLVGIGSGIENAIKEVLERNGYDHCVQVGSSLVYTQEPVDTELLGINLEEDIEDGILLEKLTEQGFMPSLGL